MNNSVADMLWILVCAGLVFGMQAGFLCLESGLTRSKNAINVAIKNLTDFSVSMLLFWAYGFAIMFGISQSGWFGTSNFFVPMDQQHSALATIFLFQAMFCATAATIVSGAVAGRIRFGAYIVITFIVSGLIYPLFGHWAWAGTLGGGGAMEGTTGWLSQLGFVDFAGSTVVHSIGGWAGLAAAMVIGPRIGRFDCNGKPKTIAASNMPLAMLGALMMWMGWIGFNGGSTLAINDQVPGIIGNTFLAGAAGMLTALVLSQRLLGHVDVSLAINGALAGLVAVTASCHAVDSVAAVMIGIIGAVVMVVARRLLERFQVDDAVGAVPVHAAAGAWGTIAVALFGDPAILATGLSRWGQLQVQATGVVVAFGLAFGGTYLILRLVRQVYPLRVTAEQERLGLNISEHHAPTDTFELISKMEMQRRDGDFSQMVEVEPYSDVEAIAAQYNRVLGRVTEETEKSAQLLRLAQDARQEAVRSEQSLKRFRASLDASPDAVFLIDPKRMQFVDMNSTACVEMGYSRSELLAMGPQDIKPYLTEGDLVLKFDEIIKTKDRVGTIETVHRRKDGSMFPVEVFLRALNLEDEEIFIAAVRDITERKEAEAIKALSHQLVEAAHLAGRSEIATTVLHNVGNVLNSVNVSAGMIQEKIRTSRVASLTRAVDIMQEHLDDLGDFVTTDERGKHLPRFLIDLSGQMADDENLILEEVHSLIDDIDHIKAIVATQQAYARNGSGVIEEVLIVELLEDAIHINMSSMNGDLVKVIRKFDEVEPVLVDKQKLLQIFVNLISNAKYACMESGNNDHQLTVGLRRSGEDRVSIEVRDNGMGIATENLTRIFAHGFTTRKEGHGFGLHSAALAAKELDGSLTAHSDGRGTGASFTLEIPYRSAEVLQ